MRAPLSANDPKRTFWLPQAQVARAATSAGNDANLARHVVMISVKAHVISTGTPDP